MIKTEVLRTRFGILNQVQNNLKTVQEDMLIVLIGLTFWIIDVFYCVVKNS